MSFVEIPDGARPPVNFNINEIQAFKCAGNGKTRVFLRGSEDGWRVECPVGEVAERIGRSS